MASISLTAAKLIGSSSLGCPRHQLLSNRYFPGVILGSSVLWMGTRGRGDMIYQVLQ